MSKKRGCTFNRLAWRDVLSFVSVAVVFAVFRLIGDAILERPGVHLRALELGGWPLTLYEALWPVVPLVVALAAGRRMGTRLRRAFTRAALVVFCLTAGFASLALTVRDMVGYSYLKYNSHHLGDAGAK